MKFFISAIILVFVLASCGKSEQAVKKEKAAALAKKNQKVRKSVNYKGPTSSDDILKQIQGEKEAEKKK
jgi:uncharacterized lipoprotein YehR (DUF1307 family)